ncbi:histone deacetylase family protein [Vibrio hippocampi]|uniref:Histone deacetylase domain-containing protein n=1 Tax=Vibrio hippocampi TaxID=654686 RepID=A0ABN8DG69_9VIBR|nr:histone deacetylase [Vibrio hippocampi]CAH0525470.1 hypothetical protein VHP8226_00993 [Vibrio hippocampi]
MQSKSIPLIYHPIYSALPLPEEHRYPIHKYRLLYQGIEQHAGWSPDAWRYHQPEPISLDVVKQVHDSDYVDQLVRGDLPAAKMRRIGFPWSELLIERTLTSVAGSCLTVDLAQQQGIAIHLSGGYHHAHYDFGSGFCLFNDLAIAAHHAVSSGVSKVLIIDSDVHHGDGTATLTQGREDIITLSLHCDKNFPAKKPSSDFDVPLARETQDGEFLMSFQQVVEFAIRLHSPDLVIYDAGVDIHQDDELGYLSISQQGIQDRDEWLLDHLKQQGIPVACVIGGGYRSDHDQLTPLHLCLLKAAKKVWSSTL